MTCLHLLTTRQAGSIDGEISRVKHVCVRQGRISDSGAMKGTCHGKRFARVVAAIPVSAHRAACARSCRGLPRHSARAGGRKGGLKRSVAIEAAGIPLGIVSAGANRHDSPLLEPTFAATLGQVGPMPQHVTGHLDVGCDSGVTRDLLAQLGFDGEISRKGVPAPIQVGKRWVVEPPR
jgi:hypothetical protein